MGTIADKLDYLNDTKTAIKNAIINKGVSISSSDTFRDYADKIDNIETKVIVPDGVKFENNTFSDGSFLEYLIFDRTNINNFLKGNTNLLNVPTINVVNSSLMVNAIATFSGCTSLTTVGELDFIGVQTPYAIFANCTSLTTLGGLKNLGSAYSTSQPANYSDYKLDLSASTSITHDSLMNIINDLYNIAGKGVQTQQLVLGNTNLARLSSAEISVATNKGWTVS